MIFKYICPKCTKEINYKNKQTLKISQLTNRKCKSCAMKSRNYTWADKVALSNYGKKRTVNQKKNLSICKIGNKNPFYGKHHTDESLEKIRISSTGRFHIVSEISKLKMSSSAKKRILRDKQAWSLGKNEKILLDKQEQIDSCTILRQHPILCNGKNLFIADGFCPESNTIYEVYEKFHKKQKVWDQKRQKEIQNALKCQFTIIWDE